MKRMKTHRLLIPAAVAVGLVAGTLGVASAQTIDPTQPSCVGQHVSEVAQMHGGMATATAVHNAMFGTELSVGEHLALIRAECAG